MEATSQTNAQDAFSTERIKNHVFMHKRTIVIILYATMELKTTLTLLFVRVFVFCCFFFFLRVFFSSKFCSFDYLFLLEIKRFSIRLALRSMRLNSRRRLKRSIARLRVKKLRGGSQVLFHGYVICILTHLVCAPAKNERNANKRIRHLFN